MKFTIKLRKLKNILKYLRKDFGFQYDISDRVLIRTLNSKKVEFGRRNFNSLLIRSEAEVHKDGYAVCLLNDLYSATKTFRGRKNSDCEINVIEHPSCMRCIHRTDLHNFAIGLVVRDIGIDTEIPTYYPDELQRWFNNHQALTSYFSMDAGDLKNMLNRLVKLFDGTAMRRGMMDILFRVENENFVMVGTDGVKLSEITIPHNGWPGSSIKWVVSFYTAKLLELVSTVFFCRIRAKRRDVTPQVYKDLSFRAGIS